MHVLLALVTATAALAALSATQETKVSAELLRAIRSDADHRVDIVVQLASPAQMLYDSCDQAGAMDMDRTHRASCVAESLQSFAERMQQPVRDLLQQHGGLFSSSMFLWIDNSVAVRGAHGELVMALARLDAVHEIDLEQILDIQPGVEAFVAG